MTTCLTCTYALGTNANGTFCRANGGFKYRPSVEICPDFNTEPYWEPLTEEQYKMLGWYVETKSNNKESQPQIEHGRKVESPPIEVKKVESKIEPRPISRWSKAAIIEGARTHGVPQTAIQIMQSMKLEDLLVIGLMQTGMEITGNMDNIEQQRHTWFYTLDLDTLKS